MDMLLSTLQHFTARSSKKGLWGVLGFMFIEGNQARFSTQLPSCHQEERRRLEEERLRLEEEERLREEEETRLQKEGGFPGSQ